MLDPMSARSKSGSEKHAFPLKHFDREEQRRGGIDARRKKDDSDKIPVICAGDQFLAEQAGIKDGYQRKFGGEVDGQHGGDGWNDNDEHERADVALGFLVALGKEGHGHDAGGEKDRNRKHHDEDGEDRVNTDVQLELGGGIGASRVKGVQVPEDRERHAHGRHGKCGRDESGGKDEKELPEHEVDSSNRAGEYGFHRAAFFFPGSEIHGGIHAPREAEKDDHVADDAAESCAADLFGRGHVVLLDFKRF